jgi:hypothetical protein
MLENVTPPLLSFCVFASSRLCVQFRIFEATP